ncbi:hypothetical protein OS493_035860 [Desmophyllum pertusum]|uniref:MYND-type domain-containing protein n=1 Tax=Desmophyllum pertusum TaxID=174260 RepID=A0A9W9ZWJ3_9CNID|nr:hypothetical protein OS493_035860 [Desmophyllum pertusum]
MADLDEEEVDMDSDRLAAYRAEPSTELAIIITESQEDEEGKSLVQAYMFMRKALGKLQINEQDKLGFTALHYAVTQKKPLLAAHLEIAKYLIEECKASIVARTYAGMTCLHCAAYVGAVDIVKLLLKHGADPQATCNDGKTAFDQARTSPDIRILLHKANRNADSSAAKRAASCANCGKVVEKLKRCARCHVTLYCGRECQKEHWKKGGHKQRCEEGIIAQISRYPFLSAISNVLHADKPTVSLSGGKTDECVASQSSVPANKSFVVKVQRPVTTADPDSSKDLIVYNVDKSVHVFIREETPVIQAL